MNNFHRNFHQIGMYGLLIMFGALVPVIAESQSTEKVFQVQEEVYQCAAVTNERYILGGSLDQCKYGLFVKGEGGQLEYNPRHMLKYGYYSIEQVARWKGTDTLISAWYYRGGDDYTSPRDGIYVMGLTAQYQVLFRDSIDNLYGSEEFGGTVLSLLVDSTDAIWVNTRYQVARWDIGNYDRNHMHVVNRFDRSHQELLGSAGVVNGEGVFFSTDTVYFVNSDLVITRKYSGLKGIRYLKYAEGEYFMLGADSVQILDETFQVIQSKALRLGEGDGRFDLKIDGEFLYLYTKEWKSKIQGQDQAGVLVLDRNTLDSLRVLLYPDGESQVFDVAFSTDSIFVIGAVKGLLSSFGFVKTVAKGELMAYEGPDIEVVDFDVKGPLIYDQSTHGNPILNRYVPVEVTVKNSGQEMIESFVIQSNQVWGINCYVVGFHRLMTEQGLMPGEQRTFEFQFKTPNDKRNRSTYRYSVVAMAPNEKLDPRMENNMKSSYADFVVPTSQFSKGIVRVHPNPVADELNIHFSAASGSEERQWTIYSLQGQVLSSGIVSVVDNQSVVSVEGFSSGIYILQVVEKTGSAQPIIVKFVKD